MIYRMAMVYRGKVCFTAYNLDDGILQSDGILGQLENILGLKRRGG
jgi:hypothetical protein